ncbi:MAG: hypothetical protein SFV54_25135 [Bryobacteraceae bacterium]|nr:hypothetical protein [Bryobacteraceae bacterium]
MAWPYATELGLVRQRHQQGELISHREIIGLLGPRHLDAIDLFFRQLRESFACPVQVRDHDGFRTVIFGYWMHYLSAVFGIREHGGMASSPYYNQAFAFVEKYLGGYHAALAAERNAIAGREGGMIGVLDAVTEALIKDHTQLYMRSVLFDLINPSDYDRRLRLAEELLAQYGPALFAGEALLPAWAIAANLEEFITAFVQQLHAIRRHWRQ